MIKKKITVRNITANYPFSGDPSKTWYCEIVDSNLGADGNPVVNYVNGGLINLTCLPRHLNATLDVIFHEDSEKVEVAKLEAVSNITSAIPDWGVSLLGKIAYYSKKAAAWVLGLMILSFVFAAVNYYFDIAGFLDEYQKYNAANGARIIDKKVNEIFNDPFYDSEGVKAIEEDLNISYEDLFTKVDEDLYVMKNPFVDEEGEAILMTYGDADSACGGLGGYVLPMEIQNKILPDKLNITVRLWSNQPEWTGTARGLFSDDYVINLKDGELVEGAYKKDGIIYGDADDVKIAARCGVLKATFIEED